MMNLESVGPEVNGVYYREGHLVPGQVPLISTHLTIGELSHPGIGMVVPFSIESTSVAGYQRVLSEEWARKLIHNLGAAYQVGGLRLTESIRISHIGEIKWDCVSRSFSIDLKADYPLGGGENYSFDGQHRIHALKVIAEERSKAGDTAVWDLAVPVTMLWNQPLHYQAWDFYLANVDRRNITPELADAILTYLATTEGVKNIPTLTKEVRNRIDDLSYGNSRSYAARLGNDKASCFYRRLMGGNEEKAVKDRRPNRDYPVSLRMLGAVIQKDLLSVSPIPNWMTGRETTRRSMSVSAISLMRLTLSLLTPSRKSGTVCSPARG